METDGSQPFLWTVVGGGPCGIIAVALLVDYLSQKERDAACSSEAEHWKTGKVAWIDPDFHVGNLPCWQEVQANSSVQSICSSLAAVPSLGFHTSQQSRAEKGQRTLRSLLPEGSDNSLKRRKVFCELGLVVDALADATSNLLKNSRVVAIRGHVTHLMQGNEREQQLWKIKCAPVVSAKHEAKAHEEQEQERQRGILASLRSLESEPDNMDNCFSAVPISSTSPPLLACTVVLATGALPKAPPPSMQKSLHVVDLSTAIIGARLRALIRWTPPPTSPDASNDTSWLGLRWTVVGSSHSAMLAVRNLIGLGVQKVQVVHRRPLLYVESRCMPPDPGGRMWLKNVGNGLVGTTGSWCRKELPLLEKSGRVVWQCFSDQKPCKEDACDETCMPKVKWESWVVQNSDVLVFAAGFESLPLPNISLTEQHGGPSKHHSRSRKDNHDELLNFDELHTVAAEKTAGRSRSRSPKHHDQNLMNTGQNLPCPPQAIPKLPGLVGLGIGFPEHYVEPDGDVDVRVSFGRYYMEYAARTLGLGTDWLHFEDGMTLYA